ncbi:MAG: TonB-dependent receptor [Bacteroidota bacterium]
MKKIFYALFMLIGLFACSASAQEQPIVLTGSILSSVNSDKLVGASITEKGTGTMVRSDENGNYKIKISNANSTLLISYTGYKTKEIEVAGRKTIAITLDTDISGLQEVVVIGYGTRRRKDLTGSISSITSKQIEDQPVMTIEQLMQGKASGVQITQTTGAPGGAIEVRIRGASSINAGNEPLFVIDGVPYYNGSQDPGGTTYGTTTPTNALASLNPNDIESIDVLKDASATAIYGSRGSNGVIIVTTKRGNSDAVRVNYNGYVGTQRIAKELDIMNAAEHATFLNAWAEANKNPLPFADPASLGAGTNWQKEIFQTAAMQNHQLSLSGGKGNNRYYISGNFFDQNGIVINTGMKRYSFRVNFDKEINKKLNFHESFSYNKTNSNAVPIKGAGSGNVRSAGERALYSSPILSIYGADGNFNTIPWYGATKFENPVASLLTTYSNLQRDNVTGNLTLDYEVIKGLTVKSLVGINLYKTDNKEYYPRSTTYIGGILGGLGFLANRQVVNILNENTVNYSAAIKKHKFDILAGLTLESENDFSSTMQPSGFPDDRLDLNNISSSTGIPLIGSSKSKWGLISLLSRVNYQFADKYLFTASIRADGSSKFSEGNKWGYFPSVAIGYRLSEEKFIKDLNFFDDLKLKASYGITGNQEVGSYQSLSRLVTDANYIIDGKLISGARLTSLANKNLTWENSKQLDIGMNASFFNSRINVGFDYYKKRTENLLFSIDIPSTSGYGSGKVLFNTGSLYNRGIEADLSAAIFTKEFKWNVIANFSKNKSILTSLGESPGTTTLFVGRTPGAKLGQTYLGIFHNQQEITDYGIQPSAKPGDMKFADINGDGKFTGADQLPIGSPIPKYIFGLTNTFNYKRFELTLFVESSVGRNGDDIDLLNDPVDLTSNKYRKFINIWTPGNTENATVPGPGVSNYSYSTFDLVNRSYYKLRNARLSYSFSPKLTKFARSASLYLSGQNLITISKYPGFDPETGSVGYPTTRTFVLGVNVGF